MAFNFTPLQTLSGTEKQQLQQVYRHLFKLSGELNTALNRLDAQVATTSNAVTAVTTATGASGTGLIDERVKSAYDNLRSLIIKNADTVYASMDEIRETLTSEYVAQSEFGTFQEELTDTITATAEGIIQNFDYTNILEPLTDDLAGFSSFQTRTEQYIKIGVVGYGDYGIPISGVVVGNNLTEVEIDGVKTIISQNMYSCFTAERLSFWKNGIEQAYLSNETLYVTNISVSNEITVGFGDNKWRIDVTNGFTIRNVG